MTNLKTLYHRLHRLTEKIKRLQRLVTLTRRKISKSKAGRHHGKSKAGHQQQEGQRS